MIMIYSLVVVVKPNGWPLGVNTFERPFSDGLPCVCALLLVLQGVAKEHLVVWLDHLKKMILNWDIIGCRVFIHRQY